MERRTRFDLFAELIELCKYPGAPISQLARKSGLRTPKARGYLRSLIEGELIRTELRERSPHGLHRSTEYFISTPDGDELLKDFTDLKSRLTMTGAEPRSGPPQQTNRA